MYQPKPIIALVCLLDLMLTLFFASLLMKDPSRSEGIVSTPARTPPALIDADSERIGQLRQVIERNERQLSALSTQTMLSKTAAVGAAERHAKTRALTAQVAAQEQRLAELSNQSTPQPSVAPRAAVMQLLAMYEKEYQSSVALTGRWTGQGACDGFSSALDMEVHGQETGMTEATTVSGRKLTGVYRRDSRLELIPTYRALLTNEGNLRPDQKPIGFNGTVNGNTFTGIVAGCSNADDRSFVLRRQ